MDYRCSFTFFIVSLPLLFAIAAHASFPFHMPSVVGFVNSKSASYVTEGTGLNTTTVKGKLLYLSGFFSPDHLSRFYYDIPKNDHEWFKVKGDTDQSESFSVQTYSRGSGRGRGCTNIIVNWTKCGAWKTTVHVDELLWRMACPLTNRAGHLSIQARTMSMNGRLISISANYSLSAFYWTVVTITPDEYSKDPPSPRSLEPRCSS